MTAEHVVGTLMGIAESLFDRCAEIADAAEPAWSGDALPASADVDVRESSCQVLEDRTVPVAGAGVVLAPGAVADRGYWMSWWQPSAGNEPRLLRAQLDPNALDFRDYTGLPWFTPVSTGRRQVTGPYVDYLCTDCYAMTFTVPLHGRGGRVGVAGVDVLVHDLETVLLPEVADGPEWIAVNDAGRVITSTVSDVTTGDLVTGSTPTPAGGWNFLRCPDLPIRVLHR